MPEPLDAFDRSIRDRIGAAEARVRVSSSPPDGRSTDAGPARWLRPALMLATAAGALVLAVFVIGQLPEPSTGDATPSPSAGEGVSSSARNGDFVLTLSSPRSTWTTEDAIEITATLSYDGDEPEVEIGGGGGPVVFSLRQREGGDAVLGGGQDLPCLRYALAPDEPLVWPFEKAGGINDDPPFDLAFFQDPELHLPPGRWEARAFLQYGIGDCSDLVLDVSIVLDVLEAEGPPGPSAVASEPPVNSAPALPSASVLPTAEPRTGWTVVDLSDIVGATDPFTYASITGVSEARGILFATGREARSMPGIWWSEDGAEWYLAEMPVSPEPYGFSVVEVIDAGPRFVALAKGGLAEGSGVFATAIYVSEDGRTWQNADSIPAIESGGHFALVESGGNLLAIGESVWVSRDGGLTWDEQLSSEEFGGQALHASASGDVVIAAGQAGTGDLAESPAYAWVSRDGGLSWQRTELSATGVATHAEVVEDGMLVVIVAGVQTEAWNSPDGQDWGGHPILPCCPGALAATPTGLVAIGANEPDRTVTTTQDGANWSTVGSVPIEVRDASWGASFGLVAVSRTQVAFGPNPIP